MSQEIMSRKRILTVEDDNLFAEYLNEVLTGLGYTVLRPAATADEAIALVKAQEPDLILMDVGLEGEIDGITAASRIQSFSDVPVVYLTGLSADPVLDKAKMTTPYGYLVKPVTREGLAATIETALYRHEAETELKRSESRFRLALGSAHMGVLEWEARTRKVFWSPECARIIGLEELGSTFEWYASLLHPDDVPSLMEAIGQVSKDHPVLQRELRIVRPDGGVRWLANSGQGYFTESGALVRIVATIQDITDRRKSDEALRLSEQRFRSLFETSKDSILLVEQEKGRIIAANAAACALYGYSREEFLALKVTDISAQPEETESVFRRSAPDVPARLHRKKDGTMFPVEVSLGYFSEGDASLHTAFVRDITERKAIEEALRRAEEKYRSLFSEMAYGAALHEIVADEGGNPVDYVTLEVNDAYESLLSSKRETALGKKASTILPIEELKHWLHIFGPVALTGESRRYSMYSPFNDRHFEGTAYSPEKGRFAVVFSDVTDRKRAEEQLLIASFCMRSATSAIGLADLEGKVTYVNDSFLRLWGYAQAEEVVGRPMSEFATLGEEAEGIKALRSGQSRVGEGRAVRKDGSSFRVQVAVSLVRRDDGQPVCMMASMLDITEEKKAEEALRESEAKLRAILDASRDAIRVSKDGIYTFANSAYVSLFGYADVDELIGTSILDVVAPESRGSVEERLKKRANGEEITSFYEMTALKKDGTRLLMEVTVSPYTLKEERFVVAIMRDVSEKKHLEEQLRQAQKMEAVGTLAGGVAHDFNNILTVVMGLANVIQMSLGSDDRLRPLIDQIVLSSERAADLTRSLLAFSRKQRISVSPHRVNDVVLATTKLLKRLLPEDIVLNVELADDHAIAMLDVGHIDQVLMNLATNARDAMPHGGSLTIMTKMTELDEAFAGAHGFGKPGKYILLSVSDTGLGMDEKTLERIFDPFFTTKEVGKGTGLGLASVYGIVKQHGGYITVRSDLRKGTTFDIYLPLVDATERAVAPSMEVKGGSETILVLEDDPDVRSLVTKILAHVGYTTLEAGNGDDAIGVFSEHGKAINLVILDVVLPGKNGREVLDEIERLDPGVRAIFMSGYTGDIILGKGVRKERVDFLQKPLSLTKLLSKVREVLDRPSSVDRRL